MAEAIPAFPHEIKRHDAESAVAAPACQVPAKQLQNNVGKQEDTGKAKKRVRKKK